MDKEKMVQEIQVRTEEIKDKAEEIHKAIEDSISQKVQMRHYTELGGRSENSAPEIKEGYGLVLGGGGGRGS